MRHIFWVVLFTCCTLAATTHAASNQQRLDEIQRQKKQSTKLTEELKEEVDGLVAEQRQLKKQLVELAAELKNKEQTLSETSEKEAAAKIDLATAKQALGARRKELEAMIQAVVRFTQVPPQAMIMMPEMSSETMQHAHTIRIMSDTLKQRTEELNTQIETLYKRRKALATLSEKTKTQLIGVEKKRTALATKVKQRATLTAKLNSQLGQEHQRIKSLAKEAKDIEQLMSLVRRKQETKKTTTIEAGVADVVAYVESAIRSGGSKNSIRSFKQMKGKLKAPAAGKIIGRYETKSTKELSKGMTIATNNGSSVSAAYDGKVAYVGTFRGYGNMVILKHSENYYTLMAGLGDISASENEVLLEGEPLGTMGSSARKLYVELRENSDPINPKGWFRGL